MNSRPPWKSLLWFSFLLAGMAAFVGSVSACFLWSLEQVTRARFANEWLIWLLPAGGFAVAWMYAKVGGRAAEGSNLLIDEIHQPAAGVPRRLAPLILLGTLMTHLVGGSAGREGTALQMGGGIAGMVARWGRLPAHRVRVLLMAGVAAGFGSVFGTPLAGAVFAVEVLVVGRMAYTALAPCFIAALVAHWVCLGWGARHDAYPMVEVVHPLPDLGLMGKVLVAAVAFGLTAAAFAASSHKLAEVWKKWVPSPEFRAAMGGFLLIGLVFLAGTRDYLGLGVLAQHPDSLHLAGMFREAGVPGHAWLWKFAFTVVTLAAGFKGGEVTPLFFIGAALGNSLALAMGAPVDLFAALGFVAVFAAATKTPLACTFMGMEIFGAGLGIPLAAACFAACAISGERSIYTSQRRVRAWFGRSHPH
jgi:H+/Cl- antiporter ClcA